MEHKARNEGKQLMTGKAGVDISYDYPMISPKLFHGISGSQSLAIMDDSHAQQPVV